MAGEGSAAAVHSYRLTLDWAVEGLFPCCYGCGSLGCQMAPVKGQGGLWNMSGCPRQSRTCFASGQRSGGRAAAERSNDRTRHSTVKRQLHTECVRLHRREARKQHLPKPQPSSRVHTVRSPRVSGCFLSCCWAIPSNPGRGPGPGAHLASSVLASTTFCLPTARLLRVQFTAAGPELKQEADQGTQHLFCQRSTWPRPRRLEPPPSLVSTGRQGQRANRPGPFAFAFAIMPVCM